MGKRVCPAYSIGPSPARWLVLVGTDKQRNHQSPKGSKAGDNSVGYIAPHASSEDNLEQSTETVLVREPDQQLEFKP